MKPEDVWVIYNKITGHVHFIFAELFMAQRKYDEVVKEAVTGTTLNKDKFVIVSLSRAMRLSNDLNYFEGSEAGGVTKEIESRWQNP